MIKQRLISFTIQRPIIKEKESQLMTIKNNLHLLIPLTCALITTITYANIASEIEPPTGMWIDQIPKTIDQFPTVLPQESSHKIVPDKQITENNSQIDQTQSKFSNSLQKRAKSIDNWFGTPNPAKPASASLRIMLDTHWHKHDDFSIKPRIRGRIKLPTLQNKFSVVFGDDSLDNEMRNNIAINNENPIGDPNKVTDSKQYRSDNASLALRWSEWKNPWDIDTDLDLGVRSTDDLYIRAKIQKDWDLANNFSTHAEQIYRYGIDSKDYLRTNLELRHARPNQAFITNQFSLTYTDDEQQEFYWDNRLFRQHQFFHENCFNYGVYLGGNIEDNSPDLNSYGPFISWRQPFLRDWFFVQAEMNYYNDKAEDRDHYIGALLRFETHFK